VPPFHILPSLPGGGGFPLYWTQNLIAQPPKQLTDLDEDEAQHC